MRLHPLRATNKSTTFGALGLLALVSVVVALGSGHRSKSIDMLSGNAWLVSNKKGQIVRVNAATGQPDAGVQVGKPGKYQVEQDGDFVIVRDANGVVRRIDTRNLTAGGAQSYGKRFNVVIGGGAAYAVDARNGVVRPLDPNTLAPRGRPIHLGGALSDEVVDSSGQLWAMVSGTGHVVEVGARGIEGSHGYGPPGDRGFLSLVGTDVVVIDTTASTIGTVGSGNVHMADLGTSGPVLAPQKTETGPLWLLASASDELISYSPGHSPATLPLRGAQGHDLGAPELIGANLYLPDFTAGSLVHVDTANGTVTQTIPFLHHSGSFDVFVSGGSLWANNDDGSAAIVVDQNGHTHDVSKYRTDVPGLDKPANQLHNPTAPPSPAPSNQAAAPNAVTGPTAAAPFGALQGPPSPGAAPGPAIAGPSAGLASGPVTAGASTGPPGTPRFLPPTAPQPLPHTVPSAPHHAAPTTTTTTTAPPKAQAPSQPIVTLTPVDSEIDATWSVAANGSKITGYDVSISPAPSSGPAQQKNITQTSQSFKNLKNGTLYTVTVIAHSYSGNSPAGSQQATPTANAPAKPVISGVTPGAGTLQVAWAPASTGSVSGYQVTATPSGLPGGCTANTSCTTQPTPTGQSVACTVTGNAALCSGLTSQYYAVQVIAIGSGASQPRSTSDPAYSRPWGAPGAPGLSVQPKNIPNNSTTGKATVTITAPGDDGGTAITGYAVSGLPGLQPSTGQQTVTGLQAGTYQVSVAARNAVGTGPAATATVTISYASGYTVKVDNTDGGFQWNGPTSGQKYAPFTDGSGQVHNYFERTTKSGEGEQGSNYYTTASDLTECRAPGSPGQRTTASWTANLPTSGTWKVYAFIPNGRDPSVTGLVSDWEYGPAYGNVDYQLGGQTVSVHQSAGQWVLIGSVTKNQAGSGSLTITDYDNPYNCQSGATNANTSTYISIDAAKWVLQ